MVRPCFLVIDREYASSISTRKLVIETAKFNVITAYSSQEAIDTIRKFPAVDGVVMDANLRDMNCDRLVERMREIHPKLIVIAISNRGRHTCKGADYTIETFQPAELLLLLKKLTPEASALIEEENEKLAEEDARDVPEV